MNRFLLVVLVVAGVFGLPYLLWVMQDSPQVEIDTSTNEALRDKDGLNWMMRHLGVKSTSDAPVKFEYLSGDITREQWNSAIDGEEKNKIILSETINWRSEGDEAFTKELQDYIGVVPTGWIVSRFQDLSKNSPEIPQWAIDAHSGEWSYEGAGYIFSNERKEIQFVLESEETLLFGTKDNFQSTTFQGWMEIVTPILEDEVDQWFKIPIEVPESLEQEGLTLEFPAFVTREHKNSRILYMTGDYSTLQSPPNLYQIFKLPEVYEYIYASRADGFYWTTFTDEFSNLFKGINTTKSKQVLKNRELVQQFKVNDSKFEVLMNDKWTEITIKGVNIGMGKPGYFPGEAAITEGEYYRWFQQIAEMNANTIRVYTIHPPGFYRALKKYNEEHDEKVYLFHGVWADEERMAETLDAYDEVVVEKFENEYKDIVDVLHGNIRILPKVGHASGIYDADVSDYVIGWVIGIEWYPYFVQGTNEKYATKTSFSGEFYSVDKGQPFEIWLAENMEGITKYEFEKYNEIRPMSFTNWVTTDLLEHASEPDEKEDLVGVDPNVIKVVGEMETVGQFASYHIYPYYPDFFNVDIAYSNYIDHRGNKNSYAGYLKDLITSHKMPVLVAEFGIPASRGMTHKNPYGWNQGFMSERQQGEVVSSLYEDILETGYAGGLVFTWQDEWFKRTWNTMDYDNPNRRPYWSNAQTNEQQFGLLSFDRHLVRVDGNLDEWEQEDLLSSTNQLELYVKSDERYLYLGISGVSEQDKLQLVIDTLPDNGVTELQPSSSIQLSDAVEFYGEIQGGEGQLLIESSYDYYHYLYHDLLGMIDAPTDEKGLFTPIYYALNKEIYYPELNETRPFEYYETGKLQRGNANPETSSYDSLNDYEYGDETLEIRFPWLLLQVKDPSQMEVMGDLRKDGAEASEIVESFGIGVIVNDDESIPEIQGGLLKPLPRYSWSKWQIPLYEERLKESYYILQQTFADLE